MDITPVELTTIDGLVLRGERWGAGPDWLVLHHDAGRDLDCWRSLQPLIAERPAWSALAIDARGHGGSDDPWDLRASAHDVEAGIDHARRCGARAVVAVGAGAGAIAALLACLGDEAPAGLALLSPEPLEGFALSDLRGQGIPKLFLVGALGEAAAAATAALRQSSIGQPLVVNFPTSEQGTDLLEGPWRLQALEHLAAFVDEQRAFAGAETPRFDRVARQPRGAV